MINFFVFPLTVYFVLSVKKWLLLLAISELLRMPSGSVYWGEYP